MDRARSELTDLADHGRRLAAGWPDIEFSQWRVTTMQTISSYFGAESIFYRELDRLNWGGSPPPNQAGVLRSLSAEQLRFHEFFAADVEKAVGVLRAAAEAVNRTGVPQPAATDASMGVGDRVVVVHGRDFAARDAMFSFLRSLELKPTEWEQAVEWTGSGAPYVGQVLDSLFEHGEAVVVMFTGDDIAFLRPELRAQNDATYDTEPTPQARPNVLFEAGLAFGRHPRRTILVEIGTTRPVSDLVGRHVIRLTEDESKFRNSLANRLESAGLRLNRAGNWLTAGAFTPRAADQRNEKGNEKNVPGARGLPRVSTHIEDKEPFTS